MEARGTDTAEPSRGDDTMPSVFDNHRQKSITANTHLEHVEDVERVATTDSQPERRRSSIAKTLLRFNDLRLGRRKSSQSSQTSAANEKASWSSLASLPAEIQTQALLYLSIPEILNFRLVSRACNDTILLNQSVLVRESLRHKLPAHCLKLYPLTSHTTCDIRLLCTMAHRYSTASRLAVALADFVQVEWMRCRTSDSVRAFSRDHSLLRRHFVVPLLTLCHLIETRRDAMLSKHAKSRAFDGLQGLQGLQAATSFDEFPYDDEDVVDASHTFDFLVAATGRQLRPASYATPIGKALRGWNSEAPSTASINNLMYMGGIEHISRVLGPRTYAERRRVLAAFCKALDADDPRRRRDTWLRLLYGPFAPRVSFPPDFWARPDGLPAMKDLGLTLRQMCIAIPDYDSMRASPREFIERILGYDIVERLRFWNSLEVQAGPRADDVDVDSERTETARLGSHTLDPWWS